jgi:hypothetical protein
MSRDIKELVKGILTGHINMESLSKDEFNEVSAVIDLMKAKFISPEQQKANKIKAIKDSNAAANPVRQSVDDEAKTPEISDEEYEAAYNFMKENPNHPISKKYWNKEVEDFGPQGSPMWEILDGGDDDEVRQQFQKLHGVNFNTKPKSVASPNKKPNLTVVKEEGDMEKKGQEIVDYSPNGQWKISKGEILEKPPVSEAQRKAMRAAAAGKSNLDIPKSVGKDFSESDPGGKLPEKVGKAETKVGKVTETMDQDVYEPRGKHDPVMESPKNLNKAIKPGPTLDYGKINPRQNTVVSPSAKQTADTSAAASEAAAPTIDYHSDPMQPPKRYAGAAERAKQVRAEIDRQANESAIETIARRQKMKKEEGANEESEPTAAEVGKMTAKAEEPHKDDPKHEAKEQEKAKTIKDKAQELLDMHKEECYKISDRGQWKID